MEQWPSKNVPKGGVFNNAKTIKYTQETKDFVQTLMNESKMSMLQRNKLNYSLRNGEPLPASTRAKNKTARPKLFEVKIRPGSSKRRSLDTIKQSGAYERELFRPEPQKPNREKAKEKLIDTMVNGPKKQEINGVSRIPKKQKQPVKEPNRFDELKNEIKERQDWLRDMEELGEGNKYRGLIQLQILERIKEMEALGNQE